MTFWPRPIRRAVGDSWYAIRDFPHRIARICAWLPILWRDRDWDNGSLVRIVEFKLRRMSKCIGSSPIHVGNERKGREMLIAAERLARAFGDHPLTPDCPGDMWQFESIPGRSTRRLKPFTGPQKLWGKRMKWAEQENWDAAWELIRKHGRGWWD